MTDWQNQMVRGGPKQNHGNNNDESNDQGQGHLKKGPKLPAEGIALEGWEEVDFQQSTGGLGGGAFATKQTTNTINV